MGSAVGKRLVERGLSELRWPGRRSERQAHCVASMTAASDEDVARADFFLSIVPPADALSLGKMAALIARSNRKPIYIDCNAVNPPTRSRSRA